MQEQIQQAADILRRYAEDDIMLDAFWQWASNPTSVSAGLALEENYLYIKENLQCRYTLTISQADKAVETLKLECGGLIHSADLYSVYHDIQSTLRGELGARLRSEVTRRVDRASLAARCAVALVHWLIAQKVPDYELNSLFNDPAATLQSLLRATLGGIPGAEVPRFQEVRDELIECGVLNRLFYRTTKGRESDRYQYGLTVPMLQLAAVIAEHEAPNVASYVAMLFEQQSLEQARVLEEVACGGVRGVPGVQEYPTYANGGLPKELLSARGLLGIFESHLAEYGESTLVAVNPLRRDAVLEALVITKAQRLAETAKQVSGVVKALRDKEWPQLEIATLKDSPDRKVWRLDSVGKPRLFVYLGNWVSESDLRFMRETGANASDSFLFILVDQSLPSIYKVAEDSLKWWQRPSITAMVIAAKGPNVNQVQGQEHAFASAIANMLGVSHVEPTRLVIPPQPEPEPQPTLMPEPQPPSPLEPYKITFPPYDDGSSLVFGRGPLKDRIAIGFEAGKELSPDTIAAWDIHSVDQPFICTFQQIGMGKSTLANCIMLQAAFQGIPVVVLDPKPDYLASLVPVVKTTERFPDYRVPIVERFRTVLQDMRGFDLSKPVKFEYEGKRMRLIYQIYSFTPQVHSLGGRSLKMPLVVLPPRSDPNFREMCDSMATSLATALHRQWQQQAYNTTLSGAFQRFREEHPERDYLLPDDLRKELQRDVDMAPSKREQTRLENLVRALQGYCTAQSWMYAQTESEVAKAEELVQNPGYPDGDRTTVTLTILDLNRLPQEKRNPARMNYVSNVCGYLYNLATRRKSDRPAQFLVLMDEAANYLPDPTDQFNNTLTLIRQGRSLGVRVWLIAQAPGQIEIQARNQAFRLVLSQIPQHAIRPELTRWQPNEAWTEKLGQTGKGQALVIDSATAKEGGLLCHLFTTPQTVNLISSDQVLQLLQ